MTELTNTEQEIVKLIALNKTDWRGSEDCVNYNVRGLIRLGHKQIDQGAGRLGTAAELIALVKSYRRDVDAERDDQRLSWCAAEAEREATAHQRYDRAAYPGGRRAAGYATATAKGSESD